MKEFKLQRGFIFGVTAVAVMAVLTGAFTRLQSISADTTALAQFANYQKDYSSSSSSCDKIESMSPTDITDSEKALAGDNAKAYIFNNTVQNKSFKVVVGASEVSQSGSGGVVKFTVAYSPINVGSNVTTYTEKKGRWLLVFNDDKYLDFYFGNPNLKVGSYQTMTRTVAISDYAWAQKVNLDLRNGTNKHYVGCIANVIDLQDMLGAEDTATTSATATASATAELRNGLKGDYYNSLNFSNGALTRLDSNINFGWGSDSPDAKVNADNFTVRWTGLIKPTYSEKYTFTLQHNNGARLWINDTLVIDKWNGLESATAVASATASATTDATYESTGDITLTAGTLYNIKVEYYETTGQATAKLAWKSASQTQQYVPKENLFTYYDPDPAAGTGTGLKGEYFSDTSMSTLVNTRQDAQINFNWGTGVPMTNVPSDNFSVRWTGQVQPRFSELYSFYVSASDGVRLWIDDQLIIDQWHDQDDVKQYVGKISLEGGKSYNIKLEYYESTNNAVAALLWSSMSQSAEVIPTTQLYYETGTPTTDTSVTPNITQVTLKHGFNAISLPSGLGLATTDAFTQRGMTAFAFNRTGDKAWKTDVYLLNHWIGYYVYNPFSEKTITLSTVQLSEDSSDKYITRGWNLLANSYSSAQTLSSMNYYISSDCSSTAGEVTCGTLGDNVTLSSLFKTTTSRAYAYIYLIKDPYASEASDAFELVKVTKDNADSITIPANTLFWIYLYN